MVYEDSPNGITAATAAGIFCAAVSNPVTVQLPLQHADIVLTLFANVILVALLERFARFTRR
jgi:beta-phosphoglucomutase-like phosphatase (HAD superfamily)